MPILELKDIVAGYGDLEVLHNISLNVNEGEIVALLGSNGAGKTTTLRIISGFVTPQKGEVIFDGINLLKKKPYQRADLKLAHIPQGRGTVAKQTVLENLILGAYSKQAKAKFNENLEKSFEMFPKLKERQSQIAGSLSGGEQQMLAIARALMMNPKMIIMDEPSLGLAPIIVEEVFEIIESVAQKSRVAILLVEQNLIQALSIAKRGYVLENGIVSMEGEAKALLTNPRITEAYLGI